MKRIGLWLAGTLLALPLVLPASTYSGDLTHAVRHELLLLPYYGIFDNLSYRVEGNTVVLEGDVTRPTLKSDAERVVRRIEGVERVENKIQVLPLSPFDDSIRIAAARAIFGYGPLQRYAWGAHPPIHIIVNNGHVTLQGVVANEADRNMANIRANGVPGVFAVTNALVIDRS